MTVRRAYFMLMVQDMDRALAFWQQGVGLVLRFGSPYWSELDAAGSTVALHHGGDGRPTMTGLGVEVDDVHAACAAIRAAGGSVLREPETRPGEPIILAEARDTEGNGFSVAQPTH